MQINVVEYSSEFNLVISRKNKTKEKLGSFLTLIFLKNK